MDCRLIAYAARQAPRYTSYPTAPHFSAKVDAQVMRQWLSELSAADTLSLYLHVPYCKQLCWYCGCNTYAARRDAPVLDFVDTLLTEVDVTAAALTAKRVVEIHWGGGTPNLLSAAQFEAIMARLQARLDLGQLIHHAIELDPRYVDKAKADAYARAGVNRVSLGVQDFNARVQTAIGRVQPLQTVARAVAALRDAGISEINMDLMYGLPHQGLDEVRNSVRLAAGLRPNRIALFGYAHVPWFKKRQRLIPEAALPDATLRFAQARTARAELEAMGYVAVGLDHFAAPNDGLARAAAEGTLRRSFQGYVIEAASAVIGLGPSAISTLPQGYAQNIAEPGAWGRAIAAGGLGVARGHALSDDDRRRARVIEHLMCAFEADLSPMGGARGCSKELATLAPMIADGMVRLDGDRLTLSAAAQPFCRLAAMAFDDYAQKSSAAKHSKAI